jgi:cob(I)alamin adenosyltransferase
VSSSGSTPPTDRPPRAEQHVRSIVIVNTGDGKGKSTAAFGIVMRAVARGWRVAVVQFIKSGDWRVGEEAVCRSLGVEWRSAGDGFTWDSSDLDETESVSRDAWETAKEIIENGGHDVVVLDEVTYPITWGWIPLDEVLRVLRERPPHVNVIATGRDAPAELIGAADTATEMVNLHHAFDAGVAARRGIDY